MTSLPSSVIKWRFFRRQMPSDVVFSLCLLCFVTCLAGKITVLADSDKSVLLRFKKTVSDPGSILASWVEESEDYCSWFGVSCDSTSRVMALNISGSGSDKGSSQISRNRFTCGDIGKFPLYGFGIRRDCAGNHGALAGNLPSVIMGLTELRVLSLPFNSFSGEIPVGIWGMEKLEVLDLEGNLMTGSLPIQFSGLRNLRVMNLGFNRVSGEIPNSLKNLSKLEILNLGGNKLNGTVPGFVGRFRVVHLPLNWLQGSLPKDIGDNCGTLEHLDLSGNFLTGRIPESLGKCGGLRSLLLYMNTLEETIPLEFGNLQKLEVLDVSRNTLSGPLPVQLGNCSSLSVLVLSNLYNVYEDINSIRGEADLPPGADLTSMTEDFNFYQGGIPEEITTLPKLKILWVPRATLEGRFPGDWGSCQNLEMVNLGQNFFKGEIPVGLSNCKNLRLLDLSSNRLTGELLKEISVPCMSVFDVGGNSLSGVIPEFLKNTTSHCPPVVYFDRFSIESYSDSSSVYLSFFTEKAQVGTSLIDLGGDGGPAVFHNFADNNFTGTLKSIPLAQERLGKRVSYIFSAGGNRLYGQFPGNLFDNCDELKAVYVNVSFNKLSGRIPQGLNNMCTSLKVLDASLNQIFGPIPSSLGDLGSLVALNLSCNQLQGQIPGSLGKKMTALTYLSIANNNLTGQIPQSFGQLHSLDVLDLSSNYLSGGIPHDFINLKNLTVLLLNNNNLSGPIPSGFATFAVFNVSSNNLSGPVPSTNGLTKCSTIRGNPYLRPCHVFSLTTPSSESRDSAGDSITQDYASSPVENAPSQSAGKGGFNSLEIASIASASAIVSVLIALVILFFYTRKWHPKSKIMATTKREVTMFMDIGVPITFDNVVRATGNFNASNLIGNGGFGATYKAEISQDVVVAIKRLSIGKNIYPQIKISSLSTLDMDHEEIPSMPSTPATTPGTPGAPLFGGFEGKRNSHNGKYTPKSLLKSCKCFSVDNEWALEDGRLPPVSCSLPPPNVSLYRKLGAEFVGTLILIFAGTATAIVNQKTNGAETLIGCAASAGLAVMIVILSTGHISGAHLNPAVTIAFAALKHFPWKHVPVYIGAQVMASVCAAFALKAVFEPTMSGGVTVPTVGLSQAFALEFIISFNLMFVVTAVATDTRAVGELAGIAVGATVMLNILIAGPATSASMNPVRTLGPAIAANNYRAIWIYLTAPILGALIGAGTYTIVKLPEEDEAPKERRSFRR